MKQVWHQDYPTHNFDIVSPELPSGSAWLVNCLLELNIPIWNPWEVQIEDEWQRLSEHVYRYNDSNHSWQQTLPALKHERVFNFDKKLVGRATHRWAPTIESGGKLILFVRDPRDMLFSQWRRSRHNHADFKLSLSGFFHSAYYQYPINHIEYVLLFLLVWKLKFNEFNGLIIRFEDYKKQPKKTLNQVLTFINVKRTDQQINQAIVQSDYQVLRKIEDGLAADGLLQRKFNFASKPLEYNSYMNESLHQLFYTEFNEISHWLGYEPYGTVQHKPDTIDAEWLSVMTECILCGAEDHPKKHELYDALKQVIGSIDQAGNSQ